MTDELTNAERIAMMQIVDPAGHNRRVAEFFLDHPRHGTQSPFLRRELLASGDRVAYGYSSRTISDVCWKALRNLHWDECYCLEIPDD